MFAETSSLLLLLLPPGKRFTPLPFNPGTMNFPSSGLVAAVAVAVVFVVVVVVVVVVVDPAGQFQTGAGFTVQLDSVWRSRPLPWAFKCLPLIHSSISSTSKFIRTYAIISPPELCHFNYSIAAAATE